MHKAVTFDDLPTEVWENIFSYLTTSPFDLTFPTNWKPTTSDVRRRQTLKALCLVNKAVAVVASILLYRHIHNFDQNKLQASLDMDESSRRFRHTRSFHAGPSRSEDHVTAAIHIFSQFPNLRHLTVELYSSPLPSAGELSRALSSLALSSLISLALQVYVPSESAHPQQSMRFRPFHLSPTVGARLKHLGVSLSPYAFPGTRIHLPQNQRLALQTFKLDCDYGDMTDYMRRLTPGTLLALDVKERGWPSRGAQPSCLEEVWPSLQHLRLELPCYDPHLLLPILSQAPNLETLDYISTRIKFTDASTNIFAELPDSVTHLSISQASNGDLDLLYKAFKAGGSHLPKLQSLTVVLDQMQDRFGPLPKGTMDVAIQQASDLWDQLWERDVDLIPAHLDSVLRKARKRPRIVPGDPPVREDGW